MEDDMARILGHDEHQDHASFLRRVSHSVRHARSYSDRGTRLSREQKWPRSPLVGSPGCASAHENSSPTSSSPELREELTWLKNELLRERQKTMAKEQRLSELETALQARNNIRQMNSELREKRSTMVVLDTQKEIVVRELEVLTEHIAAAKKSGEPLDVGRMSNMVLREFAEALQTLKDSFAPPIEDLTQQRNDLIEEVSNLTKLKDKSFQEFEQLSSKNAQLAELNNQLVHQIQELYKRNASPSMEMVQPPPNGLGIYTPHSKEKYPASLDGRELKTPSIADSNLTGSTVMQEHDGDPATYLTAPQVVKIRKAQPKKFNWKRGGHTVAKGVTKGLKGAFASSDPNKVSREGQFSEGPPYGSMPPHQEPLHGNMSRGQMHDPNRQGFGFFGNPKGKPLQLKSTPNGIPAVNADGIPGTYRFYSIYPGPLY
jgi:Rho-type GTPase-activating protein 1/2